MTRSNYMTRFSRAARWFLPQEEAAEAVADYDEMFAEGESAEADVCSALGDPVQAASLLRDARVYRTWVAVFSLLALCAALPLLWLLRPQWHSFPIRPIAAAGALAALTALVWFRRNRRAAPTRLPKGLPAALGGVLALAVLAAGVIAAIYSAWVQQIIPSGSMGWTARALLQTFGLVFFLAAAAGLVLARLSDRRWRALYLLGLDLLLVCAALIAMLTNMDIEGGSFSMLRDLSQIGGMGLVGLVAAGVSLC